MIKDKKEFILKTHNISKQRTSGKEKKKKQETLKKRTKQNFEERNLQQLKFKYSQGNLNAY